MKAIVLLFLFVVAVSSQDPPKPVSFVLPGVIHDVYPCDPRAWIVAPDGTQLDSDHCSPDVEAYCGNCQSVIPGMVASTLDSKRKLIYQDAYWTQNGLPRRAQNKTTFDWLFNVPINNGRSRDISYNLTLTNLDPANSDVYSFNDQKFWPINGKGWGNYELFPGNNNFHFCMEVHAYFNYRGGEVFNFLGDDDLWIYVDNRLALDLGGIHPAKPGQIRCDEFGLTKGRTYPFDVFYCERNTDGSTIKIDTTMAIFCPPDQLDACGVCQGNGACCPNKCETSNKCLIAQRNVKTCECTITEDVNLRFNCTQQSNRCQTFSCSPSTGKCTSTNIPDPKPELNNGCYQPGYCDPAKGWIHVPKNDTCLPAACKLDNHCVPGSGPDDFTCEFTPCRTDFCDTSLPCPNYGSKCFDTLCDEVSQGCKNVTKVFPAQIDACTTAVCNDTTGEYTYTSSCVSNLCTVRSCESGTCVSQPKPCDDYNNCTQNLCNESTGECYYEPIDLAALTGSDTCLTVTCNPNAGISYSRMGTDIPCPNGDRCKPDPTVAGCCVCRPVLSAGAIAGISAGAIAGAVIGGVAGAALLGVGGKVGYDFYKNNAGQGAPVQNNPLYVESPSFDNPLRQ